MKVESLRVVIDSNVWISAALSPDGAPAKVVRRVLEYGLAVFSPATFAELETRLWKPKFDRYLSMELRRRLLHDIDAAAFWVDVPPAIAVQSYCRDVDDDKFIHTALAAQAPWLVTGDRDLLDVAAIPGLRIPTPAETILLPEFAAGG
jgi:putative PIN family toxin of toxin-antitoxin system